MTTPGYPAGFLTHSGNPRIVGRVEYDRLLAAWVCGEIAKSEGYPPKFNPYHPIAYAELHEMFIVGWRGIELPVLYMPASSL